MDFKKHGFSYSETKLVCYQESALREALESFTAWRLSWSKSEEIS